MFTIATVNDVRSLERVVKKIWRSLKKKHKRIGELHASHEKDATRRRMLQRLNEVEDLKIQCVILNKEKVHVDLQNQKNLLYNFTANILLDRFHSKGVVSESEELNLYIDRKDTKKKLRENFVKYLASSMAKRRVGTFKVELHTSHENRSLQAVDFISWAVFRKYEFGDYEYYEMIKKRVVDERLLFP